MDDNTTDAALHHADVQAEQEAALAALRHAHALGLGESECMALAYPAGIANDFYKEIRK